MADPEWSGDSCGPDADDVHELISHSSSKRVPRRRPAGRPEPLGGLFQGILFEIRQRRAYCWADYMTALRHPSKTLAAALFMFFATLFSTVALGHLIEKRTKYRMGLSEYLTMNAISGVTHALIGTQPLLVLRPTGPITAITVKLADVADSFGYDFHQFMAATGLCVGLLMAISAATQISRHIKRLTPFTHDVFACFVCSIYLHDGVSDVLSRLDTSTLSTFGQTLFALNLAVVTLGASVWLTGAPSWPVLPSFLRTLVSDYAVTLAVVLTTAISFSSVLVAHNVSRISLPAEFGPTCHYAAAAHGHTHTCVAAHASDAPAAVRRAWFVGLPTDPMCWLVAGSASIPITFFFYMDQNISSLLCQLPEMGLQRGSYLHVSFLLMGLFNVVGPLFGLPFVTGSLPHSPQFVRALTFAAQTQPDGSPLVAENRVAPLLMYALIGLPLLAPAALSTIPEAAIDGILAYVGYEGIVSTDLWSRVVLLFTPRENFPPRYGSMHAGRVHAYTFVQILMWSLCWAVNLSPLGLCVAFVVVSLVPLREKLLLLIFTAAELAILDEGRPVVPGSPREAVDGEAEGFRRNTRIGDGPQYTTKTLDAQPDAEAPPPASPPASEADEADAPDAAEGDPEAPLIEVDAEAPPA